MMPSRNYPVVPEGATPGLSIIVRDCFKTLSENGKLSLASTLVPFWKSTKAKDLKRTSLVNKSVIKQNSWQPLLLTNNGPSSLPLDQPHGNQYDWIQQHINTNLR
jgi:hypothetical protein